MKKLSAIFLTGLVSVSLVGCSGMSNQDSGTLIGGVAGGLLGSQFGGGSGAVAATLVGAAAGAYIGNQVGKSMDKTDRLQMAHSLESNRTDQTSQWRNPDTGNIYSVTPTKTYYQKREHRYCREFIQHAEIAGKKQEIYGTACRQPDGTWQVVNEKHQH